MYALATGSLCLIIGLERAVAGSGRPRKGRCRDSRRRQGVRRGAGAARCGGDRRALHDRRRPARLVGGMAQRPGRARQGHAGVIAAHRRQPHHHARNHPLSGARRRDRRRPLRDHRRHRRRPPDVVDVRDDARGWRLAHRGHSQHAPGSSRSMITRPRALLLAVAGRRSWRAVRAGIAVGSGLAGVPRTRRPGSLDRARRAARVERVAKRRVEDGRSRVRAGRRPSSSGGRVWLTTAVGGSRRCRCARWPSTSRPAAKSSTSRCSASRSDGAHQSEEQPRLTDAHRRGRPRLRALRRGRHRGADDRRRDRVEGAIPLRVAARRRRIAGPPWRSADLQLRRRRRRVRRGARQAHRQDALEDVATATVGSGVHDAARDSRRRSRSGRERRRVPRRRLRSARPARRSGASATATASRTCRGRSTATGSSTSRRDSTSRRSSPSGPTAPAT